MIIITEANKQYFRKMDKALNLSVFMDKKMFRPADTSLTYRQINTLAEFKVLPEDRESTKKWRAFTTREIIFLQLIEVLRKYGLKNKQLASLRHDFYSKVAKNVSYTAVGLAIVKRPMYLLINDKFEAKFMDNESINLVIETSCIIVNLNTLVDPMIWKDNERRQLLVMGLPLTDKELKVIQLLRNNDYKRISVMKKSGELYSAKCRNDKEFNEPDSKLISIVNSRDYSDISLTKRDGKVVHLSIDDLIIL